MKLIKFGHIFEEDGKLHFEGFNYDGEGAPISPQAGLILCAIDRLYDAVEEFGEDAHGQPRKTQLLPSVSSENEEEFRLDEKNRVYDMKKE